MKRTFFASAAALLMITAGAKIASTAGSSKILDVPDPIFLTNYRNLFYGVGLVEICAALMFLANLSDKIKAYLGIWLSSSFVVYRLGAWMISPQAKCPCLGTFTAFLKIPEFVADSMLKAVIAYIMIGSIIVLTGFPNRLRQKQNRTGLVAEAG